MLSPQLLTNAVNGFTGTLTFPLDLVSIPGRSGLDLVLSATYAGNTQQNAVTWNMEASTGVLGLGWSLGLEYVFVDTHRSGVASGNTYYYVAGASASELIPASVSGSVTTFTLASYRFWKIAYDASTETWTMVKENGVTSVFGGGVTRSGNGNASAGNAIEWGVTWGAWSDSSAVTAGQNQFALIWHLRSVTDTWANTIAYAYTSFADDQIAVGTNGLPYTRAAYLASITDSYGNVVTCSYASKSYDTSTPAGQREYQPAHSGAANTPVAYQDRYETRYLVSIGVASAAGSPLSGVAFASQVTGLGDLAKRYLTGVTQIDALGESLPSLQFTYGSDAGAGPLGAMTSATLPSGSTFTFSYGAQPLQAAALTTPILKSYGTPQMWFESDYALVTWIDGDKFAHTYLYQFFGGWIESSQGSFAAAGAYPNLQVATEPDLCAILRPQYTVSSTVKPQIMLYHKDGSRPGSWIGASVWLDGIGDTEPMELISGRSFVAVLGKTSGLLYRFIWNGTAWVLPGSPVQLPAFGSGTLYTACGKNNWIAAISRAATSSNEMVRVTLFVLAPSGWQTAFQNDVQSTVVNALNIWSYAGDSFVVLKIYNDRTFFNDYRFQALNWSATMSAVTASTLIGDGGADDVPAVRGSLVGIGSRIFRYTGATWANSIDLASSDYRYPNQTGDRPNLAYGYDQVVRRVVQSISGGVDAYAFDVSAYFPATAAWGVDAFNGATLPSVQQFSWGFLPIASHTVRIPSQYAIVSDQIYYQSPNGTWSVVGTIPKDVATNNAASVQLLGSRYVAYQSGSDAVIVPLHNGALLSPIVIPGQTIAAGSGNGQTLTGPTGFATFTGSFSSPASLTLYALVNGQVQGTARGWAVTSVAVNDGFDTTYVSYAYDTSKARCDASGVVGLYNRSREVAGSAVATTAPYGYTDSYHFNGTSSAQSLVPFPADVQTSNAATSYGYLTGQVYRRDVVDASAATVASKSSYWWVTSVQAGLGSAQYSRTMRLDETTGTLTVTTLTVFGASNGLPTQTSMQFTNPSGAAETVTRRYTYAGDAYAQLAALNVLAPVVQTTQENTIASTVFTVSSSVTTWAQWPSGGWGPNKQYQSVANGSSFNFAGWSGTTEPPAAQWVNTGRTFARTAGGLVLESCDAEQIPGSTIYDSNARFPIARFTNASVASSAAAYLGFEPYQATTGWTIGTGGTLYTGDSHTGTRCLQLTAAGGVPTVGLQTQLTPAIQTQQYYLSFWIKTQPGFGADGGTAYAQITVTGQTTPTQVAVHDTAGAWLQLTSGAIALPAGGGGTIAIAFTSSKATTWFLLDDIVFAPVISTFAGSVYAADATVTAELSNNAGTVRTLFGGARVPLVRTGPDGTVISVSATDLVRADTTRTVSPLAPNLITTITARTGGTCEQFTADWQTRWTATNPSTWSVANRALTHAGSTSGTCTWTAYDGAQNYGVRVQVNPVGTAMPTGKVGIMLGTVEVSWLPATGSTTRGNWYLGTTKITSPTGDGTFPYARDWMLAYVDSRVFFWANGRKVLDTIPAAASGTLVLEASVPVSFAGLATFEEPAIAARFADGNGNERQTQVMSDNLNAALVSMPVYDALLRPAIACKAANFTAAGSSPLFVYQPGYVTNGGPGGTVWTSGTMTGAITTEYPDDGGYPFARTQYESSPLGRVIGVARPGAPFSLAGHPRTFAYGADASGAYFTTTESDPNGAVTTTTVDFAGNPVSQKRGPTVAGGTTYVSTTYAYAYTATGIRTTTTLPTGTAIVEQRDFLGHLISRTTPDEGTTQYIYDVGGRAHYALYADGVSSVPAQDVVLAWCYDALARPTSAGTLNADWSTLPVLPALQAVPPGLVQRRAATYFPAGTSDLGRLQQTQMFASGAPQVTESYGYTTAGLVAAKTQTFAGGAVTDTTAIAYAYDAIGNATQITYGSGAPFAVTYTYNRRGLVQNVGNAQAPAIYASYTYEPDGSVNLETLGFAGSRGITDTYLYESPGWIDQVAYTAFTEIISYDSPGAGYGGAVYYDGSVQTDSARGLWDGAPPGYVYSNGYDGLGRLQFAQNTASTAYGLGISSGVQYDGNDNLTFLNRGNDNLTFAYAPGTNRLSATTGYVAQSFGYSASGQPTSVTPAITQLTYDSFTRLTASITVAQPAPATLTFSYGARGQRVYKGTNFGGAAGGRIYVHGMEDYPLVEKSVAADGTVTPTYYVRTPNGLVATSSSAGVRYVVRDLVGSTRIVIDNTGAVLAAFDYMPFGTLIRSSGDLSLMTYRYTGQEFDALSADGSTGLYNYRARLYDPVIGRFYGPDPLPEPASPYVYAANRPFNNVDPTGLFWREALYVIGAAAAGIIAGALLPATVASLALATGALIVYGGATLLGGAIGTARGADTGDVMDWAASFGAAGVAGYGAAPLALAAGMGYVSIGLTYAFGVINGLSIAPAGAQPSSYGYYIAAGIGISFASEFAGNAVAAQFVGPAAMPGYQAVSRAGIVRSSAFENAVSASTIATLVQKGTSNALSGAATYGGSAYTAGASASTIAGRAAYGASVYGAGAVFGVVGRAEAVAAWAARPGVVAPLNVGLQILAEQVVKQSTVMLADNSVFYSRLAKVKGVLGM